MERLGRQTLPRWPYGRGGYLALALATIAIGLTVHLAGGALPPAPRDILGDALWAAMMAWWVAVVVPDAGWRARAAMALALCFAVEWSQRFHAPALDAFRTTTVGHLTLGSGFDPRDLVAYTAGVLAAVLLELAVARSRRPAV